MRTSIEPRQVETHDVGQTANFTIKANGKAFKVLIDGLYSDKIRAVIREIWSNAYDAHRMADKHDQPFECQLPNQFDPIFRVRDYGVGMDHDTVMHLYTTVFESTKEDTNDQVGKFGLGSKSPFAYTDTFTITAYSGKEARVYSAFIGKSYVPQIALMANTPSKEPRGIEIQFPVNAQDVSAFIEAAKLTARGFDVVPIITGARVEITALETIMAGTGWKIVKNDSIYGLRAHAKQGCVVYPLDPNALDRISEFEKAILSSPFFIDFAIGDLEISASRESIGYDEDTKKNIRHRLTEIADEIVALYQAEIDAAPTMWQACQRFKKVLKSNLASGVLNVLRARITYKGKHLQPRKDLGDVLRPAFDKTLEDGGLRAMKIDSYSLNKGLMHTRMRRPSLKFEASIYIQVEAGETIVIFDDAEKPASNPQGRIRFFYQKLTAAEQSEVLWVKATRNSMAYKRLLIELGRPEVVINLADLEKPPVDKADFAARRPTKVKVLTGSTWVETEIDENDDIIFVELKNRDTLNHDGVAGSSASQVNEATKLLKNLGYMDADVKVYGIPQTHKNKITTNDHWVSLWTLAKQAVNEKFDAVKAATARSFANKMRSNDALSTFMIGLVQWKDFAGFENEHSPATKLLGCWATAASKTEMSKDLNEAYSLHLILGGLALVTREISFRTIEHVFVKTYPLIDALFTERHYVNPVTRKNMIDYVNLVDAANRFGQDDTVIDAQAA